MAIVYWRHANDNEKSPAKKHDPRATGKGRHNARKMARRMARKRGAPDVIYVSPMRRCRDTVRSMIEGLEKDGHPAPRLVIDENLSRYFCSREQKKPRVRASTGDVPIVEGWSQFRRRVRKRAEFLWKTHGAAEGEVVWCITHALVMKQLALFHSETIPSWLDFLFHFAPDPKSVPGGDAEKPRRHKKRRAARGSAPKAKSKHAGHGHGHCRACAEKRARKRGSSVEVVPTLR